MFKFLEDEHTCAFAHDETVAAGAEGSAGTCGVIVAGREGMHGIEASHSARSDGSFCTAGHHDIGLAETDEVEGGRDGVGAGGTCRGGGVVGAMEAILYGNLSGSDVCNHLGDEEGVEARTAFCTVDSVVGNLLFEGVDTADADTKHHSDAVLVDGLEVHGAVSNGFHCCYESELLVTVHLAHFLLVDEVGRIEILYFAGELCLEFRSVKALDGGCSADAGYEIVPGFFEGVADGGDCSEASNYYSFQFHMGKCWGVDVCGVDVMYGGGWRVC